MGTPLYVQMCGRLLDVSRKYARRDPYEVMFKVEHSSNPERSSGTFVVFGKMRRGSPVWSCSDLNIRQIRGAPRSTCLCQTFAGFERREPYMVMFRSEHMPNPLQILSGAPESRCLRHTFGLSHISAKGPLLHHV